MVVEESVKAPGNPSERVNDMDRWSALALKEQEGMRHLESVCVSPLFGGQRCRSLLKCVVGSHQASFLPSEEEPFVMDNIT